MADGRVDELVEEHTIGDILDRSVMDTSMKIHEIIMESKLKKQACNEDSILKQCINRDITDEQGFRSAIQKLVNEGLVTINIRSGKVIYSAIETCTDIIESSVVHVSDTDHFSFTETNLSEDFRDFKKHVCNSLAELNDRFDHLRDRENLVVIENKELKSQLKAKDIIIEFLREETKNLNHIIGKLIDERQNQQSVNTQNSPFKKDLIKNKCNIEPKNVRQVYHVTCQLMKSNYIAIIDVLCQVKILHLNYISN